MKGQISIEAIFGVMLFLVILIIIIGYTGSLNRAAESLDSVWRASSLCNNFQTVLVKVYSAGSGSYSNFQVPFDTNVDVNANAIIVRTSDTGSICFIPFNSIEKDGNNAFILVGEALFRLENDNRTVVITNA